MSVNVASPLDWLERRSSTLFLVAGVILAAYAALNGLWAFTDVIPQQNGLEIGYVVAFFGLLGLYPGLVGRQPRLARIGAIAAMCGIVSLFVISMTDLSQLAGLVSGNPPGWGVIRLLPLVGFLFGYSAFGIASLRSGRYPRAVCLLLLVPSAIVVVMLALIVTGYTSGLQVFVVSAGEAMAHLAIGASLRTDAENSAVRDDVASTRDSDVEATGGSDAELPAHD